MAKQEAKYQKIIDWVKQNIADGTFHYGDKLMSESELGAMFGLSRQTVRHATGELVNQKLVTRVRGSGTYIGGAYQPTRTERYMSIAVVSTFYESYIFPPTLKGIGQVLSGAGYTMQVSFTDNRVQREREILLSILEKDNIDGLIVEPAKSALPNPNLSYYEEIKRRNIPIISFNASYPGLYVPCVRLDDTKIAQHATKMLLDAGHRKIAGIFKSDDGQGPLRYQGFMQEMLRWGEDLDPEKILWIDTPQTLHLADLADHIFRRIQGASAVVCYNDEVAYQLIELAIQRGIRVPDDLSVIGIDDSNLARIGKVPFTSFPHPKEELGQRTAEHLLRMIEQPEFDGNFLYDSQPVERGSVKKIG